LYAAGGVLALGAGYRLRGSVLSSAISVVGFGGIIAGVAVWLRRRGYRAARADYPRDDEAPP
jgi:hypothetical protein